jgi:Co/Zn/Cd efflux system component
MVLLYLALIVLAAAIMYLFATQIVDPIVRGIKIFPAFRKTKLSDEVVETLNKVHLMKEKSDNLKQLAELAAQHSVYQKSIETFEAKIKATATATEVKAEEVKAEEVNQKSNKE